MNSEQIIQVIRESSKLLKQDFDGLALSEVHSSSRSYQQEEVNEFMRDLTEAGNNQRIIYLENSLPLQDFKSFLAEIEIPVVAFKLNKEEIVPVIFHRHKKDIRIIAVLDGRQQVTVCDFDSFPDLYAENGLVSFMGVFAYKSLVSDDVEVGENRRNLSPFQRLMRLLSEEKKDITYVYFYAILIGFISLTLPVGIQATVSLISGGVVFSSVYLLIGLVILGVIVAGGLQIMQITLVEYLQRRVFTKAAFEFAFRIPRIKAEALVNYHAPELMNRFFDVLTIQKGLPKLLIDLSAGVIQILFGLILLSFYHPTFVFFSFLLLGLLFFIFYATGPKGLTSSIRESKFKYMVVYWLEELARTINSFKLSGNTPLPIRKTDYNVNNYLKNRKVHFQVLISQYSFILLFKALVTGGLLIIGTILVVERQITLGQFVAAEVIIILTLNSVEKIIMYMDVIYDMLTAVDKISQVTDLPLEKSGGIDIPKPLLQQGFNVKVKNLKYKYPNRDEYSLNGVDFSVERGESVCISGKGSSGKRVLTNSIAGLHNHYEGIITIDGFSLRDLDLMNLRDRIGKNVSQEDIFEGSIIENVLLSKPHADPADAVWAIKTVGIDDEINKMPDGLDTMMVSGGKGLSDDLMNKLILARCLAKRPNLLILNDFFNDFLKHEIVDIMQILTSKEHPWTLLVVSNDPIIMTMCDRVVLMDGGDIKAEGKFNELDKAGKLKDIID